jgi:hypothetical protein
MLAIDLHHRAGIELLGGSYPNTETFAGGHALVPMCQSPKIVNVPVHAEKRPANDNRRLAETSVKPFQAKGAFAAVWLAFLGLLCVSVMLLF